MLGWILIIKQRLYGILVLVCIYAACSGDTYLSGPADFTVFKCWGSEDTVNIFYGIDAYSTHVPDGGMCSDQ